MNINQNTNIHIIGISGLECSSIAIHLIKKGYKNLTLHDLCNKEDLLKNIESQCKAYSAVENLERYNTIINSETRIKFGKDYLNKIEEAELIFAPQSWDMHENNEILKNYIDKIYNIIELYFEFFEGRIIGITGSAGKSSASNYLYQCLKQLSNEKIILTGNDRATKTALEEIENSKNSTLIIEISNRQLKYSKNIKPDIAIITNIKSNHISEHGTFENYKKCKLKITELQNTSDYLITNKDFINIKTKANKIISGKSITALEFPNLPAFTLENYNFVYEVLNLLKFKKSDILDSLRKVKNLKERFETIYQDKKLRIINDRQSTSIDSSVKSLESLKNTQTIVIFGGATKDAKLEPLYKILKYSNFHPIGIKSPISDAVSTQMPLTIVENLTNAVKESIIKANYIKGVVNIILSPACEYGPYFKNKTNLKDYENFNQLVFDQINSNNYKNDE